MVWKIEFDEEAVKDLEKITPNDQKKILKFIRHINALPSPKSSGKPLKGTLNGLWRYRVGNYRIICKIENRLLLILIIAIGHRKNIYSKHN